MGTAAVVVLGGMLAACDLAMMGLQAEARSEWGERFTIAPGGRLEIDNTNGSIAAEPASGDQVEVRAERVARAATDAAARELLGQVEIRVDRSDGRVKVTSRHPRTGFGGATEVRYTVKVPVPVELRLENTNGRIELRNLAGRVEARTVNGAISGERLAGPMKLATTNGAVDVALVGIGDEGVELSTTNGGVTLRLPVTARADVIASCVNGGISVSGLTLDVFESSRRRLEGRLNGGGPRVRLQTTNGGIHLVGVKPGD